MQQLPDPSQQPDQPTPPRFNWWWLVLLAGLAAWNLIAFWPTVNQQIEIPYSDLIAQIKADNVTSIQIDGSTLSGQFKRAIPDPQAALTPTPAASATPSSNSTRILLAPSRLVEVRERIPEMPLIEASSGSVICDSMTSALAPVYLVVTVTMGGSTLGYSRIPRK